MPAHRIDFFLRGLPEALARQARQAALLQQAYSDVAPPALMPFSRVGALSAGRLTLLADSGSVAAKLKQVSPRLLLELQKRGLEVNRIDVRVQVPEKPRPIPDSEKKHRKISSQALKGLNNLAEGLAPSPLKLALQAFVARQRRSQANKKINNQTTRSRRSTT